MNQSLDDLIDFLLERVSLCGREGACHVDIAKFTKSFYHLSEVQEIGDDEPTNTKIHRPLTQRVNDAFVDRIWTWLSVHPDIRLTKGDNDKSLELRNDTNRQAILAELVSHANPNSSRLFASSDRMWHTLTGHEEDFKRVSSLEFDLLSMIGIQGRDGITQPELTTISGQDKRSVPKRTDKLAQNGYIQKRGVFIKGFRTSLCILSKFCSPSSIDNSLLNNASKPKGEELGEDGIIDISKLLNDVYEFLNFEEFRDLEEFKNKHRLPKKRSWNSRTLQRLLRRLEELGCIERIAPGSMAKTLHGRLLRYPSQEERRMLGGSVTDQDTAILTHSRGITGLPYGDASSVIHYENGTGDLSFVLVPQWTPEQPLSNIIFNVVDEAGLHGLISGALASASTGVFYKRPMFHLLTRLTDAQQQSQPLFLRHLSVLRDTTIIEKTVQYVYRSFEHFKRLVELGEASWETIGYSRPQDQETSGDSATYPCRFSTVLAKDLVINDGSATLSQCHDAFAKRVSHPARNVVELSPILDSAQCEGLLDQPMTQHEPNGFDSRALSIPRRRGRPPKLPPAEGLISLERSSQSMEQQWLSTWTARIRSMAERLAKSELLSSHGASGSMSPVELNGVINSEHQHVELQETHLRGTSKFSDSAQITMVGQRPLKRRKILHEPAKTLPVDTSTNQEMLSIDSDLPAFQKRKRLSEVVERPTKTFRSATSNLIEHEGFHARTEVLMDQLKDMRLPGLYINPPSLLPQFQKKGLGSCLVAVFKSPRLSEMECFQLNASAEKTETNAKRPKGPALAQLSAEVVVPTAMEGTVFVVDNSTHSKISQEEERRSDTTGTASPNVPKRYETPGMRLDRAEIPHNPSYQKVGGDSTGLVLGSEEPSGVDVQRTKLELKTLSGRGSLGLKRSRIVMEILDKAGGAHPGDDEITAPFIIEWLRVENDHSPERRTVNATVKLLVDSGKIRRLTFMFNSRNGVRITKHILTKLDVKPESEVVQSMQRTIAELYPRSYFPLRAGEGGIGLQKADTRTVSTSYPGFGSTMPIHRIPAWRRFQTTNQTFRDAQTSACMTSKTDQDFVKRTLPFRREQHPSTPNLDYRSTRVRNKTNESESNLPLSMKELLSNITHRRRRAGVNITGNSQELFDWEVNQVAKWEMKSTNLFTSSQPLQNVRFLLYGEGLPEGWFSGTPLSEKIIFEEVMCFSNTFTLGEGIGFGEKLVRNVRKTKPVSELIGTRLSWTGLDYGWTRNMRSSTRNNGQLRRSHPTRDISLQSTSQTMFTNSYAHQSLSPRPQRGPIPLAPKSSNHAKSRAPRAQLRSLRANLITSQPRSFDTNLTNHRNAGKTSPSPLVASRALVRKSSSLPKMSHLLSDIPLASARKPRGPRSDVLLTPDQVYELILIIVIVQVLTGGVERDTNWNLIARILDSELDSGAVKARYNYLRSKHRILLQRMRQDFQSGFLTGYETGQIREIDFEALHDYDWNSLIDWAKDHLNVTVDDDETLLPGSRAALEKIYSIEQSEVFEVAMDDLWAPSITVVRREEIMSQATFTLPLRLSQKPMNLPELTKEEKCLDKDGETYSVVDSYIRANVLTARETYDAKSAHAKLAQFADTTLDRAINKLIELKIIKAETKGRPDSKMQFRIADRFSGALKKCWEKSAFFELATRYQNLIDTSLNQPEFMKHPYHAKDGESLVVFELAAAHRIDLDLILPSINTETLEPSNDKELTIWGFGSGNYKTSKLDRYKLVFDIYLSPTYLWNYGVGPSKQSPSSLNEHQDKLNARIPIWYDIHDQLIVSMWDMVLQFVVTQLVWRPGITAAGLVRLSNYGLGLWELESVLERLRQVGVARKLDNGWIALPGWWTVFGPGDLALSR